ncbi:tRNA (adenosine(37)-N6)-dimethylallyltransferase MiaA [Aquibium sp. LZ166]|uniref:tRNA dimethylallyltransferase n=1 Tax=Aquibium pacificus TaxID=3153579 RepID=A0ABV3SEL8_9HYPH
MVATNDTGGEAPEIGPGPLKDAILIAGPTASGKSALALAVAKATGGEIVNADSMQVYAVLRILTARPGEAELAQVPHHLYGHVEPDRRYSTGAWLRDVAALPRQTAGQRKRYIFTGGTGLYFRAMTEGLSEMPPVPAEIRDKWRERLLHEGADALHRMLCEMDAGSGERIRPADGQRIVRALEILEATGRTIGEWQSRPGRPLVDRSSVQMFVIDPDRTALRARIDGRFERMMEAGGLDEVRRLLDLGLDPALPAMKAIGVPELGGFLRGEVSLDEAVARAKAATRQYAKRQATWFRTQFGPEWRKIQMPSISENPDLPLTV